MSPDELTRLQARLPAGIKITFVRGNIHYAVRTSRHGRKYSLGTFADLEQAIDALLKFKTDILTRPKEDTKHVKLGPSGQAAAVKTFEEAQQIMDEIGVHNLESGKAYKHITEDGKHLLIPAKYVDMYIHLTYYGELPAEDQTTAPAPQSGISTDDL